jgi:diaminopimelate epimerase
MVFFFTKMHGAGNDFIIIDDRNRIVPLNTVSQIATKLCDRHYGIGADGLILLHHSKKADYAMRIFNADGSEAEMCGNGIRCLAKYLYDHLQDQRLVFSIETKAGLKVPTLIIKKNKVVAVEVEMGAPLIGLEKTVATDIGDLQGMSISIGNPHFVIFVKDLNTLNIKQVGAQIENERNLFPERTNVEFVEIITNNQIRVRIWERGVGETLACGTGACAAVVCGVINKKLQQKTTVKLLGGILQIEYQQAQQSLFMTGPATTVFEGKI